MKRKKENIFSIITYTNPTACFCPECGKKNTIDWKSETRPFILKAAEGWPIVKAEYFFYKCSSCGFQFSTTESDSESLKNIKSQSVQSN